MSQYGSPYPPPLRPGLDLPQSGAFYSPQAPPPTDHRGADPRRPTFEFIGYSSWGRRFVAYWVDGLLTSLAALPLLVGYVAIVINSTKVANPDGTTTIITHNPAWAVPAVVVGVVTGAIFFVWNQFLRVGRTGATYGKQLLKIRVVNANLQPIGGGWSFLRFLAGYVNSLLCYVGWLWPLWDRRHQTIGDKLVGTYVIRATVPQPPQA